MAQNEIPEPHVSIYELWVCVSRISSPHIAAGPYKDRDTAVTAKAHLDDRPSILGRKARYEVMSLDDYITEREDHARTEAMYDDY